MVNPSRLKANHFLEFLKKIYTVEFDDGLSRSASDVFISFDG